MVEMGWESISLAATDLNKSLSRGERPSCTGEWPFPRPYRISSIVFLLRIWYHNQLLESIHRGVQLTDIGLV